MKYKVAELEGALLDAAVHMARTGTMPMFVNCTFDGGQPQSSCPRYSTEWQVGGPIIERERIVLNSYINRWEAFALASDRVVERLSNGGSSGPTPLIAAMRAYVTSKFGEEVELP